MAPPVFSPFARFPTEAAIIGRLVVLYGELEYALCGCLTAVILEHHVDTAFRALLRIRGGAARIDVADALMYATYQKFELGEAYDVALSALRWCKNIRNQYAHSHWHDGGADGLFFMELEEAAKGKAGDLDVKFRHVDATLLTQQEEHFRYTDEWLHYLPLELLHRQRKFPSQTRPRAPKIVPPPNRHNPPKEYPLRSPIGGDKPLP
jgi:hypothetical protein